MRLAILSDVHGNLPALEAVLADLQARGGADATVVAGDLCLAGPQPREALARVRALDCPVIQGNTDRDLAAAPEATAASDDAALLDWTRAQLDEDGLAYLRTLPFAHRVTPPDAADGRATVLIVHANPRNLDDPLRPLAPEADLTHLLDEVAPDVAVVAFGHLHIPYVREVGGLTLADIASVGLPKDEDPRAAYGLLEWDGSAWSVELRRVEYPLDETARLLREADPPGVAELIRTLRRARYPSMTKARGGRLPTTSASAARRAGQSTSGDAPRAEPDVGPAPAAASVPTESRRRGRGGGPLAAPEPSAAAVGGEASMPARADRTRARGTAGSTPAAMSTAPPTQRAVTMARPDESAGREMGVDEAAPAPPSATAGAGTNEGVETPEGGAQGVDEEGAGAMIEPTVAGATPGGGDAALEANAELALSGTATLDDSSGVGKGAPPAVPDAGADVLVAADGTTPLMVGEEPLTVPLPPDDRLLAAAGVRAEADGTELRPLTAATSDVSGGDDSSREPSAPGGTAAGVIEGAGATDAAPSLPILSAAALLPETSVLGDLAENAGDTDDGEATVADEEHGGDAKAARKAAKRADKEAKRAAKAAATAPPDLDAEQPLGATVRRLLEGRLDAVLAQAEAAHAGDPEAVHDMRVATRRLRAALDAVEPVSKPKAFKRQYRAVRDLGRALGGVRERDVTLAFLRERLAAVAEDERPGLAGLVALVEAGREEAREGLLAALDRLRDEDFAGKFRTFIAGKHKGKKRASFIDVATGELVDRLEAFEARAGVFADPAVTPDALDAEELHELRIAAKRLRYTVELFSAVPGGSAADLIDDLKGLQDGLGTLHDRDVLEVTLREERRVAAERQADFLAEVATTPGGRAERLAAVHEELRGPDSFALTAPGVYGLLADIDDERRGLRAGILARWRELEARGFLGRLRGLAQGLNGDE